MGAPLADRIQERLPGPVAGIVRRLRSEDVFLLAAGLGFYALVSVVPFSMLVLWLVSLVTGKARVHEVAERFAHLLPAQLGIERALQRIANLGLGLGLGALAALVWPATAYGAGLRRSLARMCHSDEEARGLRGRALAVGFLGLVVAGLLVTALVASYVGTNLLGHGVVARVAGWVIALVFGFVGSGLAVTAIYRLFAPTSPSWRSTLRGSATAAAAISVLSLGYAVFLNLGVDFQRRYATSGLSAIVLLALWLFLANALILVGFQVVQEM